MEMANRLVRIEDGEILRQDTGAEGKSETMPKV
jgi:putative ABC transport system ATP-binding protein